MRRTSKGARQTHPLELRPPRERLIMPSARARAQSFLGCLLVLYSIGVAVWLVLRLYPYFSAVQQ